MTTPVEMQTFRVFFDGVEQWSQQGESAEAVLRECVKGCPDADWIAVRSLDQVDRVAYDRLTDRWLL